MIIKGTAISMIRGDSESIQVNMKNSDGQAVPFIEGDTLHLTVRADYSSEDTIVSKKITEFSGGVATIVILPVDTHSARIGKYIYDIQLTRADGTVTTIIKPDTFEILGDVTRE